MAKSNNAISTASVLAFERKLDPSDGLFSAGRWNDIENSAKWTALAVHEKSVRGTISNRLKTKDQDSAKLDAAIENPNLQRVDVATLPNDADTLRVRFTLKILGGAGAPSACNNADYQARLRDVVESYVKEFSFGELARRYACNLANARFLWRNRVGAEDVRVDVRHLVKGEVANQTWSFDAMAFNLRDMSVVPESARQMLDELASVIKSGLSGDGYVLLEVVAYARMGDGQEVYPSQELILDKGDKRGQKSKTLYSVGHSGGECAALHSQKIDTWYPQPDGATVGPIAVEPYGSVTNQGKAWRQPKDKVDFYSLLDAWVLKDQAPKLEGDRHFVMATLIRGGVFGDSDKD